MCVKALCSIESWLCALTYFWKEDLVLSAQIFNLVRSSTL
jgi:hypothetical protein